jgi:hypothetical protein
MIGARDLLLMARTGGALTRARATSWATSPPIEWPTTSIVVSPSAPVKAIASRAIASMVPGTVPLEDATPVLLNKMTSRSLAKASLRAGS